MKNIMLLFLFLLLNLFPFGGAAIAAKVEMNDVAILIPLPKTAGEISNLIASTAKGRFGDVLPEWVWDKLPMLRIGSTKEDLRRELKVVAVRLDPCFREGDNVTAMECRVQLRIVMQPVFFDVRGRSGKVSTRDAAVHLFFEMGRGELNAVLEKIQGLNTDDMRKRLVVDAPLTVHPILKQGNSEIGEKFKTILLDVIGETRLKRVTFMTVAGLDVRWTFGGFDIVSERYKRDIEIVGTRDFEQTMTSETSYPIPLYSDIEPVSAAKDNLMDFAVGEWLLKQSREKKRDAVRAIFRVENPLKHNPGTVDCVSCHMGTIAKAWSAENGLEGANGLEGVEGRYVCELEAGRKNLSEADPREHVLRAFGYFREKSAVSDRTLLEVCEVAKRWNLGL